MHGRLFFCEMIFLVFTLSYSVEEKKQGIALASYIKLAMLKQKERFSNVSRCILFFVYKSIPYIT